MEEQKVIKKQLLKSMLYTFITFTIIFTVFDFVVYNLAAASIFNSVDLELIKAKENVEKIGSEPKINGINNRNNVSDGTENSIPSSNFAKANGVEKENIQSGDVNFDKGNNVKNNVNPRLIYIIRNEDGTITNEDNLGRFYNDYITDVLFDKQIKNQIYLTSINNSYYYRGINFVITNESGDEEYIQILVNVDGETQSLSNMLKTIITTTIIMILISIIVSYILSKRTLKPIIESWRRQTEFVQNASHELRTPLTIIQAKQELLLQEPNKKIIDKSQDITVCLNETRRLSKLVKELMSLARADSNKFDLNKEETNIDELIKNVAEAYIELAQMQNKEVKLELNCGKKINVDRNKMSQLLIIVLDNAIKYTSEGEKITVSTKLKDGKLQLEVVDTGIGISKEGLKHIFERFYRDDKARSRETGGTGLGLAIAQTIVLSHNGNIKIVKNEPKGTRVIIKI